MNLAGLNVFCIMTNLKEDLNAYLSRNESKNGISVSFGMQKLGKLFKKEELEETEDLLSSNQKYYYNCDFCPSLVCTIFKTILHTYLNISVIKI